MEGEGEGREAGVPKVLYETDLAKCGGSFLIDGKIPRLYDTVNP